ncbi:hypothetical protein FRC07_014140, partial [Ceratobasidium sp. 392]
MNVIENLWEELDWAVHACVPKAWNVDELWRYIWEEWYNIGQDYIDHLYESLPTRVQKLVEAKGGNT